MAKEARAAQFTSHERLFWQMLGVLARQGFVAPPDEGRDLIHDFYVEAWQGVVNRFDAERGSFTTYLSGAFYRFARRRIALLRTWQARLVELDDVLEQPSEDAGPMERAAQREMLALVTRALGTLPAQQRAVLYAYANADKRPERVLAAQNHMSRYAFRAALTEAVGRMALQIGSFRADSVNYQVARCLWTEGRSARQTAARLGLRVDEVQAARTAFAAGFVQAFRNIHQHRS